MAAIIIPRRALTFRPRRPVLNTDSPQAENLALWVPVHDAMVGNTTSARLKDLVSGAEFYEGSFGDPSDLVATGAGFGGQMLLRDAGSSPYGFYESARVFGATTSGHTIAVWIPAHTTPFSVGGTLLKVGDTGTGFGIGLGNSTWDNSGDEVVCLFEAVRWIATGVSITRSRDNLVALSLAGTAVRIYLNGVQIYSDASGAPNQAANSTGIMGYFTGGSSRSPWAAACEFRMWHRSLTAGEHWDLYDPRTRWGHYRVPSNVLYFDMGAPPAGVTVGGRRPFAIKRGIRLRVHRAS